MPTMIQASRAERVLELLRGRMGPRNAITAAEIGERLFGDRGLDRQVRLVIEELVKGGRGEILATTGGEAFPGAPPGYFWAENWQQVQRYYDVLVSRLEELRKRMDATWAARQRLRREPPAQQSLNLGVIAPPNLHRWGFDPVGKRRR